MKRILLILSILFMSFAPIGHGILAYHFSAVQTLLPEEEPHQEKNDIKTELKEKFPANFISLNKLEENLTRLALAHSHEILSKGFIEIPFTPPDHTC